MYGALWRVLPGPAWLRVIILLVLVAAVVYALFTWVFPWVQQEFFTPPDVTIEE